MKKFGSYCENDNKLTYINLNINMNKLNKINPETKFPPLLWYHTQWWNNREWNKRLWFSFPILDIGNRRGSTDYIDFITPKEDMSSPVMIGLDTFCRPFICLVCVCFDDDSLSSPKYYAQTFFQRYTNEMSWASGSAYVKNSNNYERNEILETSGGMKDSQINFINDLLLNYTMKNIEIDISKYDKNNIKFYSDSKKIRIMTQQEFDLLKT